MIHLFLIRHGVTKANIDHVFQLDNEPLSEMGVDQVHAITSFLDKLNISRIYSSPMQRAMDTANILSSSSRVSIDIDTRIREVESSSLIKGKSVYAKEYKELVTNVDKNFFQRKEEKVSDEETYSDVSNRANEFLKDITEGNTRANIIAVTHHRFISFLLSKMLGYESAENLHCYFEHFFNLENASIIHVTHESDSINRYTGNKSPWKLVSIHQIEPLVS